MPVIRPMIRLSVGALIILAVAVLPVAAYPLRGYTVQGTAVENPSLRGVAASENDNERDCDQYDDNDNDLGPNLIDQWLQGFYEFEEARDTEIDNLDELIGEIVEARVEAHPKPSQAEIEAKRAQLRGLVRQAVEARLLARAGQETVIALPENRVALRLFPTLQRDLTITVRLVDARTLPPPPGPPAGPFAFELRAQAADGSETRTLPAEAHLSATYTDGEATGLDKSRLALARLDPSTGQWQTAPKPAADPANNYVAATVVDLGTFIIYQRPSP
jgi:hypothetical protein